MFGGTQPRVHQESDWPEPVSAASPISARIRGSQAVRLGEPENIVFTHFTVIKLFIEGIN
jgi:hypothetical protein